VLFLKNTVNENLRLSAVVATLAESARPNWNSGMMD